jgi:hypothetical protein
MLDFLVLGAVLVLGQPGVLPLDHLPAAEPAARAPLVDDGWQPPTWGNLLQGPALPSPRPRRKARPSATSAGQLAAPGSEESEELPRLLPIGPGSGEDAEQQGETPAERRGEPGEPVQINAPLLPPPGPSMADVRTAPPPPTFTDRWWFMREVQGTWLGAALDDNRLYLTGWVEQSYTASTDRVSNVTVVWNDRANQYLMQQAWVRFGRSVVTTGTTPSWGFQIDILSGSDYRFTLPRGLLNSQLQNSTGAQNLYGVDPIQHYVSLYVPTLFRGVEFRVGRLYTPWGVESLEAVSTPLLSRSYAFNWSPPFTHSGGGAYITFSPEWSAVLLAVNGNDVYFGDPSAEWRFVGNVKWTQPGGGRNTVTLATSLGSGWFNPSAPFAPATVALANEPFGRNNFNAFDLVWTHTFSPVLAYNLEAIYGYQNNVPGAALSGATYDPNGFYFANWFSAAHYLFYTISPRASAIVRYENFDDFQGQRTGFAGLYTAITGGLQFRLRKGMIIRPEIRYDYNSDSRPYEGKHGILTAASDLIIRW